MSTQATPPHQKKQTKQNKTEWLELSIYRFPKQRIIYQGKKIWCWFHCHEVLHSSTMLKCVSHKCTSTELSYGAKSYPSAAWGSSEAEAVLPYQSFSNIVWKLILHDGVICLEGTTYFDRYLLKSIAIFLIFANENCTCVLSEKQWIWPHVHSFYLT